MSANLDDARRAYEAAKRIMAYEADNGVFQRDARLLLTNAEAEYRAALFDAAERRFDALGIRVGETLCCVPGDDVTGRPPFIVTRLAAIPDDGLVFAFGDDGKCVNAAKLRPYTAPEAKQMVLTGTSTMGWGQMPMQHDTHRLTLSNVTPADLDSMQDQITGTFTLEKL